MHGANCNVDHQLVRAKLMVRRRLGMYKSSGWIVRYLKSIEDKL